MGHTDKWCQEFCNLHKFDELNEVRFVKHVHWIVDTITNKIHSPIGGYWNFLGSQDTRASHKEWIEINFFLFCFTYATIITGNWWKSNTWIYRESLSWPSIVSMDVLGSYHNHLFPHCYWHNLLCTCTLVLLFYSIIQNLLNSSAYMYMYIIPSFVLVCVKNWYETSHVNLILRQGHSQT